jgi:tetratricopeptide (TPR) repeat protein
MSLLLEALKKAEKAKEEAQRQARGAAGGRAETDATAVQPQPHVTTRHELPPLSTALEIASEDLAVGERPKPALELAPEEPPTPEPRPAPHGAPRREGARVATTAPAADRAAARNVFEAKIGEPNPRLPFYLTLGVLGVAAAGTFVYFWIQLRPVPPLVNTNPPRPPGEVSAPAVAQPRPAGATPAAPPERLPAEIPGLPAKLPATASAPQAQAPKPPVAESPAPKPASPAPAAASAAQAAPPAPFAGTERASPPRSEAPRTLAISRPALEIHPRVQSGYAAWQAGDLERARADYEAALREDASNRDALLGLAAVEMRQQRYAEADALYQRLLRANPRDPHAHAGILALRGPTLDPVQAETRVKTLLAADPDSPVLHFTLGNQYALQNRWAEAQQAYFRAWTGDPESADYAFNLAVSLDHLGQYALALEYYRRALALAERRPASFAVESARTRAAQLAR